MFILYIFMIFIPGIITLILSDVFKKIKIIKYFVPLICLIIFLVFIIIEEDPYILRSIRYFGLFDFVFDLLDFTKMQMHSLFQFIITLILCLKIDTSVINKKVNTNDVIKNPNNTDLKNKENSREASGFFLKMIFIILGIALLLFVLVIINFLINGISFP